MQHSPSFAGPDSGHLIALPSTEWGLWRWAALRGAGFPATGVLKLAASPQAIAAIDAVIHAESAVQAAQENAYKRADAALDELKVTGGWSDKRKRRGLFKARARTRAGRMSASADGELSAAKQELERARAVYEWLFTESQAHSSGAIREIARDGAFREAIAWQNPAALHNVLDPLARATASDGQGGFTERQRRELVASYWQRYCVKNDTIGFFGPVGWARFAYDAKSLTADPGKQLLETRTTYWERWAIEALGAVLAERDDIRPWIAPFLMPSVRMEGSVVHHLELGSVPFSARDAALLRACNGHDTAKQIATRLLRSADRCFQTEGEIYAALHQLASSKYVLWKFNVPLFAYPERALRQGLERIGDATVREYALSQLDELDSAKQRVQAAAGDAGKLHTAYRSLEETFTRLTGLPPTRHNGRGYAGRTLVYEDCRRDIDVRFGPELLDTLSAPLSLLLTGARWFTKSVAEVYKAKLREVHSELALLAGTPEVDAGAFFAMAAPHFFARAPLLIEPIEEEFRRKWARILDFGQGSEPVQYSSDELRERIAEEFPADHPGWTRACYHSPDIIVAAESQEAIQRGDYFFVLGELHVSVNTLAASLFVNQHPSPNELIDAVERDLGASDIVPVWSNSDILGSRTAFSLIPESNYQLEYATDSFALNRAKALSVSSLVIENLDGELIASTRDNTVRGNVIDILGRLLSAATADCFKVASRRRHTPRVSIDRLVVRRESWRFPASELTFAQCGDSGERFLQARIWARQQSIPRFLFCRAPMERKPSYVDLESPILVDLFSKLIRRTLNEVSSDASLDLSEMLPTTDQLWLTDADGHRYTSEFRFIAVDASASRRREGLAKPTVTYSDTEKPMEPLACLL